VNFRWYARNRSSCNIVIRSINRKRAAPVAAFKVATAACGVDATTPNKKINLDLLLFG
jgi:hypothetical protein